MRVRLIAIYTQGRLSAETEESKSTWCVGLCTAALMHTAAQVQRRRQTRTHMQVRTWNQRWLQDDCVRSGRMNQNTVTAMATSSPGTRSQTTDLVSWPRTSCSRGSARDPAPLSIRGSGHYSGHVGPGPVKQMLQRRRPDLVSDEKKNKCLQINVSLPQMNGSRQLSGTIHIHPQLSKAN